MCRVRLGQCQGSQEHPTGGLMEKGEEFLPLGLRVRLWPLEYGLDGNHIVPSLGPCLQRCRSFLDHLTVIEKPSKIPSTAERHLFSHSCRPHLVLRTDRSSRRDTCAQKTDHNCFSLQARMNYKHMNGASRNRAFLPAALQANYVKESNGCQHMELERKDIRHQMGPN